jgi:hypothetical protein
MSPQFCAADLRTNDKRNIQYRPIEVTALALMTDIFKKLLSNIAEFVYL